MDELQVFLPVKRVELERKEEGDRPAITVRVIGAGLSLESTTCAEHFLRGILSAYPYRIASSNVSEGMIELRAEEEKGRRV